MAVADAEKTGRTEHWVSLVVWIALVVIAIGIGVAQTDRNPAVTLMLKLAASKPPPAADAPAGMLLPPTGTRALSPEEHFSPETLSDKINGKAELYLSSGFVRLITRRFVLADRPDEWFEVYAYDMGAPRNAFAVFSLQKREHSRPLPFTALSYRTENGIYWAHGHYYSEMVGAVSSEALVTAMNQAATDFIQRFPAAAEAMLETDLFPQDGLQADSIKLIPTDAFGCDKMNQVFVADYDTAAGPMTAYLSRREQEAEARRLADGYVQFLLAFGGEAVTPAAGPPDRRVVKIFDTYEVVLVSGAFLAGVREAADLAGAEALAARLAAELEDHAKHNR